MMKFFVWCMLACSIEGFRHVGNNRVMFVKEKMTHDHISRSSSSYLMLHSLLPTAKREGWNPSIAAGI